MTGICIRADAAWDPSSNIMGGRSHEDDVLGRTADQQHYLESVWL